MPYWAGDWTYEGVRSQVLGYSGLSWMAGPQGSPFGRRIMAGCVAAGLVVLEERVMSVAAMALRACEVLEETESSAARVVGVRIEVTRIPRGNRWRIMPGLLRMLM